MAEVDWLVPEVQAQVEAASWRRAVAALRSSIAGVKPASNGYWSYACYSPALLLVAAGRLLLPDAGRVRIAVLEHRSIIRAPEPLDGLSLIEGARLIDGCGQSVAVHLLGSREPAEATGILHDGRFAIAGPELRLNQETAHISVLIGMHGVATAIDPAARSLPLYDGHGAVLAARL